MMRFYLFFVILSSFFTAQLCLADETESDKTEEIKSNDLPDASASSLPADDAKIPEEKRVVKQEQNDAQDNAVATEKEEEKSKEDKNKKSSTFSENKTAPNIDLKEVVHEPPVTEVFSEPVDNHLLDVPDMPSPKPDDKTVLRTTDKVKSKNQIRKVLGIDVEPATTTRLNWVPSKSFSGMAVDTPVLVVNGEWDGPTLCLTAAIHGDELNGIEMVRRVLYNLDPKKLHGMVVGVPIVNLLGFSRNSRYLPDRRDLNRHFPGNPRGSAASRLAFAFFKDVIQHCDALVDLHTGSFYRTNITQLRADMRNEKVVEFVTLFGDIPVLNTAGNPNSLRAAAVRVNIPTVTLEAGEPMRMQIEVVNEGVKAIHTLLEKNGMYPSFSLWAKPSPAFYSSTWSRSNAAGILFSKVKLGASIKKGEVLGEIINPVTNEKQEILSHTDGRVLGMALDQFVLPGFAAYHIGLRRERAEDTLDESKKLIESNSVENSSASRSPANGGLPVVEESIPLTPEEEGFDD